MLCSILLPVPPLDGYGIIEPWLPRKAQIQFNKFGNYGIWVIFALFWYVEPLNQLFWSSTYAISEFLGVPLEMAGLGYSLFKKQIGIVILGFLVFLWIFRWKEVSWYNRGEKLKKMERYEEAIAAYDQAIKIQPKYYEAWFDKAILLGKLQRYEEALVACKKVIEIQPEEAQAWYFRGLVLEELGRYEDAIASYDKATEIDKHLEEVWYYKGRTLEKWKRYEEALAPYEEAIKIKPDYYEAWYAKANLLYQLQRYEEALVVYEKVVQLQPNEPDTWSGRGNALTELQRYEDAIASYEKAIQIQDDYPFAWYNKACCYAVQGNISLAIETLRQAITLDPNRFKEYAKTDSSFDAIRENQQFKNIIDQ